MSNYDDYTPHIYYNDEDVNEKKELPEAPVDDKQKKRQGAKKTTASAKKVNVKAKKETESAKAKDTSIQDGFKSFFASRTTAVVTGIILAGLTAYFLISFVSYLGSCLSDQSVIYNNELGSVPPVANKGGEGGARLSEFLINGGFGIGAFVVIIWFACVSLRLLIGKPRFKLLDFTIKCLIALVTVSLIIGLFTVGSNTAINWGGYHGRYVNEWIIGFIGWWGAVILCCVMIALFVVICMRDIIKWCLEKKRILDAKRREAAERKAKEQEAARELAAQLQAEAEADRIAEGTPESPQQEMPEGFVFNSSTVYSDIPEESEERSTDVDSTDSISSAVYDEIKDETDEQTEGNGKPDEKAGDSSSEDEPKEQEATEGDEPMVVNVNHIAKADKPGQDHGKKSMYKFPSLELLRKQDETINVDAEEQLANKERIKQTLLEYGVPIVSIEAHVGPTVTLYEIRPDKGNRISRIKGLVDEIAMSLAAIGVRIIAPIPGKGTIGIEVANLNPKTVSLRSILESKKYQESKASLPIALGSTISNEVYIADLASIPHLLVAGATGQGKSVGLNVIIMSLLYKKRPDELKFVMFDPKMVEFNLYAAIQKQYLAKLPDEEDAIVTDMKKVVPTLTSLCIEMDNRYKLLKEAEVRKLEEYNRLIKTGKFKDDPNHRYLPYIVVVVDEFADLIMTAGREVEMPIARLAQKARAVGIHVIIATQRPSTQVITGNIKTNFPGRIAFKVSASYDSKTILDTMGAQQLIGRGDMLILNNSELVRVQCAFVDTPEVKEICEHISKQPYAPTDPYLLPEVTGAEDFNPEAGGGGGGGDKDPLYEDIRAYVISSGVASTSNIQRKYQLGYNRAGRIMDQLEADGVVGPSQGGKARSVLISP